MRTFTFLLCAAGLMVAAAQAAPQNDLWRVDAEHSTASIWVHPRDEKSAPLNVGIAKVSGFAFWDHHDISRSDFHLDIYPARQDSVLFDDEGNFRRDAITNLARYTLMSFKSQSAALDSGDRLVLTGNLEVTYVDRATTTEWSVAYSGAVASPPEIRDSTHEIRLVVERVPPERQNDWPAANADLLASITTTDEAFPGLQRQLRDSIWPVVVQDERCKMPPATASADMRGYRGAECLGTPVLISPTGEMPAWSDAGYSGSLEKNAGPGRHDQIHILVRLRLIEAKPKVEKNPGN
jgi:polyisoprenoid-binding protein YceI